MKKYLVIGNPIKHSLSPNLHNYWIRKNNIEANYEKKLIVENDLKKIISEIREDKINGLNVTVPFKKSIIPLMDQLTSKATLTKSVNVVFKEGDEIIGDNTDITGFELSLKNINYDIKDKKILVLGAGGVTSSIIISLFGAEKIFLTNRTKEKADHLSKMNLHKNIEVIDWESKNRNISELDMIINTTSLGLSNNDFIDLEYEKIGTNKLFYDVIYNPSKTDFLLKAEKYGNKIENGKMMFIHQAQLSFELWHNILPEIDKETIKLINQ
jgi:shikimate dehydrogenase